MLVIAHRLSTIRGADCILGEVSHIEPAHAHAIPHIVVSPSCLLTRKVTSRMRRFIPTYVSPKHATHKHFCQSCNRGNTMPRYTNNMCAHAKVTCSFKYIAHIRIPLTQLPTLRTRIQTLRTNMQHTNIWYTPTNTLVTFCMN